jgi:hypothetical protein
MPAMDKKDECLQELDKLIDGGKELFSSMQHAEVCGCNIRIDELGVLEKAKDFDIIACPACGVEYVVSVHWVKQIGLNNVKFYPDRWTKEFIRNHTANRHPDCPLILKGICATCNKKNDCDYSNDSVIECECWGNKEMKIPKRIQRKRTKGWKMPAEAIYVGRSTKWGNPFTDQDAVKRYREIFVESIAMLKPGDTMFFNGREYTVDDLKELRGKDLVCWCSLKKECHADLLLTLANWE